MTLILTVAALMSIAILSILWKMLVTLFRQSEQAYAAHISFYFAVLRLKLLLAVIIAIIIVIFIFKLDVNARLFRPSAVSKAGSGFPVGQGQPSQKTYRDGDLYYKNGVEYTLVDKATYQLDNLDHFPTVELNGQVFILVRKERKPKS